MMTLKSLVRWFLYEDALFWGDFADLFFDELLTVDPSGSVVGESEAARSRIGVAEDSVFAFMG